ncbi:TonB-dependent receptor [Nitrogeniibacter aestuarii]|uniref:TonB-dependent receptor n=1 Tax=Nitrogeniibacter aestuarii TaxID=2815343 RepID=UPI001D12916E|nr:TonB-dependent receptor [Nitrogeniibacter aestuarii]
MFAPTPRRMAFSLALALSFPLPALAADDAELSALRDEIRQLRAAYEQRLADLESRLEQQQAAPAPAAAAPVAPVAHAAPRGGGFNPDVSLILMGQYRRMKDIDERHISGFTSVAEHGDDDHAHGAGSRGFSIDHSELVFSANIDNRFTGLANFAMADGEVEVEEAWFETLGLGHGLTVRGGRFRSGIGYANQQHPHAWDFADASLMYQALFGEHASYANDGLQLRWVAPTPVYLEFGAEVGRGANFPGTDRDTNGVGSGALYAHLGGDVGTSHSWRAGLSYLNARAEDRHSHFEDVGGEEVHTNFSGTSRAWILDGVWKWAPDGNARDRYLKLQGEYFIRKERGDLECNGATGTACDGGVDSDYLTRQSGWYAQAVYQFMPEWRVGLRYDRLDPGTQDYGVNNANLEREDHNPHRTTLMADWSPSEFARLRLQWARDQSMAGETDNQLWLQYIMSLGAHGAHTF